MTDGHLSRDDTFGASTNEPSASENAAPPSASPAQFPPAVPPPGYGDNLDPVLASSLHELLLSASGQLGEAYQALIENPGGRPVDWLPATNIANQGALSNKLAVVRAVLNQQTPRGPALARQVASSIRVLLKRVPPSQPAVRTHLAQVLASVLDIESDAHASEVETAELEAKSAALEAESEESLRNAAGVYVYTYPHYWRYPYVTGSERRLLKVGRTSHNAWQRVRDQARATGAPENPLLLRVYVADDAQAAERKFHRLLDAAEHARSEGSSAGREWFVTTIDFLDEIALVLGFRVLRAELDSDSS